MRKIYLMLVCTIILSLCIGSNRSYAYEKEKNVMDVERFTDEEKIVLYAEDFLG